MKKILSLLIAVLIVLSAVSCSQNISEETTEKQATETTAADTSSDTSIETTKETIAETNETTAGDETEYIEGYDPISEKIGSYVILEYNPMYCSVESSVSPSIGSKEKIVLNVTMKNGYIFDGWSLDNYECNKLTSTGGAGRDTYSITVNKETKVFVNCSMKVLYDANGGKTNEGKDILETTYCVSEYKCPSTLPDKGYFSREGYVLSEYNTAPDGSGEAVSLGSKIRSDSSELTLYCIWLKEDSSQDFDYTKSEGVTITKYKGNNKDVVIPEKIDGVSVTTIAKKAFSELDIETVFLPKTIETVSRASFYKCDKLTTLVFFDSILSFDKDAAAECPNFRYVRINAVQDMYYEWMVGSYCKTDRLIWSKDMKKFIFYGGSGTLHAIKCDMVNKEIGDEYVIINMGANANVSAAFVFEGMRKWLKDEDIILWCPEMSASPLGKADMTGSLGKRNIEIYVSGNYDFLKGVDVTQYPGFFDAMTQVFSDRDKHKVSWEMGGIGYNCYGDTVSSPDQKLFDNSYSFPTAPNLSSYKRMQFMIKELKGMGVETWFSYAVMDETGTGITEEKAKQYEENIKKTFDVTIISDFWDCFVPHDCMADSIWHVTLEGADIRTKQIIKDIMKQFEKTKQGASSS